jgi:hypothetical protein
MGCAAIEVDNPDHARLPLSEHPGRRVVTPHWQCRGVGDLYLDRVTREIRLGAHELEAGLLAYGAAPSVAAHQKARTNALLAGMDGDLVVRGLEAGDVMSALDLDTAGQRVGAKDALDMLHLGPQLGVGRTRESVRPA